MFVQVRRGGWARPIELASLFAQSGEEFCEGGEGPPKTSLSIVESIFFAESIPSGTSQYVAEPSLRRLALSVSGRVCACSKIRETRT